jgi:hypothetical protein
MTVQQLINGLQHMDPKAHVYVATGDQELFPLHADMVDEHTERASNVVVLDLTVPETE